MLEALHKYFTLAMCGPQVKSISHFLSLFVSSTHCTARDTVLGRNHSSSIKKRKKIDVATTTEGVGPLQAVDRSQRTPLCHTGFAIGALMSEREAAEVLVGMPVDGTVGTLIDIIP